MMRTLKAGSRCRGQMLIAFAFGLVALLSAAGLVVDGGNLLIQRRTAQNAADAAALAGARALSVATSASDSTVATAICQYVTSNRAGQAPTAGASFVNSNGTTVGAIGLTSNCQGSQTATTIPATAAGVRVVATIGPFATFFLASAGIPTWTVSAAASSRVTQLASITPGAPIVAGCGGYMYDNTGGSYHGSLNIFVGSTPPRINYTTYMGRTFMLLGRNLSTGSGAYPSNPSCPAASSSAFRGAINPGTAAIMLPADVTTLGGDYDVSPGVQGMCTATGQSIPTSTSSACYLPIPITSASGNGATSAHVITFACMQVFGRGASTSDRWDGVLTAPAKCPVPPNSTFGSWSYSGGSNGILAISLAS